MKMSLLCGNYVSLLGFGCMRFPQINGGIDYEKSKNMIDFALSSGINYFDTSYIYHGGQSEIFLNKALISRYMRNKYFIADKLPINLCNTKDDAKNIYEIQMNKLGLNYLDFHVLHAVNNDRWKSAQKLKILDFQRSLKECGKVKHIGFSFHDTPEVLEKILDENYLWDFIMLQINYYDWESSINSKKMYQLCTERNIPIIVMEPLRGGNLINLSENIKNIFYDNNKYLSIASWPLRFAGSLDNVKIVLSGMTAIEQVKDNVNTFADFHPLRDEEYFVVKKALDEILKIKLIACTECRYCQICPQDIDIASSISAYNKYKSLNSTTEITKNYMNTISLNRRSDKCINCKICLSHCPQKIDIPSILSEINNTIKFLQRKQKIGKQLYSYRDKKELY